MNYVTYKLVDDKGREFQQIRYPKDSVMYINDEVIEELCELEGIEELKRLTILLGVHNTALVIRDYTLTDIIYIDNFYDVISNISIFEVEDVNIHMIKQNIDEMKIDCQKVLLVDCNIKKVDIGIYYHLINSIRTYEYDPYEMNTIDLRNVNIHSFNLLGTCNNIVIQGSKVDEFNDCGNLYSTTKSSQIDKMQIYKNTIIQNLSISSNINKLRLEDSTINKIFAYAKTKIENIETKNCIIENCFGFNRNNFTQLDYTCWEWIEKSAMNSHDTNKRAEANYEITKLKYKNCEVKSDKFMYTLFDYCVGYGFKPFRVFRTATWVMLLSTVLFSVSDFIKVINIGSIVIDKITLLKGLEGIFENFIQAFAAFVGQNLFDPSDGFCWIVSILESGAGIILFAMFVNAMYLRFK